MFVCLCYILNSEQTEVQLFVSFIRFVRHWNETKRDNIFWLLNLPYSFRVCEVDWVGNHQYMSTLRDFLWLSRQLQCIKDIVSKTTGLRFDFISYNIWQINEFHRQSKPQTLKGRRIRDLRATLKAVKRLIRKSVFRRYYAYLFI